MRSFKKLGAVTLAAMAMALVACGGGSDAGGSSEGDPASAGAALTFEAKASPLADFSYDTGMLPEGSPAQVQLKLSAGGGLAVTAAAEKGASGLSGKDGGGKLALDLHLKVDGTLKVDTTFTKYDGPIPGLKDIDIPIAGSVPFDGLLLDPSDSALATADLPETTLPEIPLGSVPGSLVLTVAQGSTLSTKFHATCLAVADGSASYSGESKTSGKLLLKAKIVLKLPTPFDKTIDLPDITVPIAEITTATDAKPLAVSGVDDGTQGTCGPKTASSATPGGSDPGSTGTGTGSGSSDPGGSGSGSGTDGGTGSGGGSDGGAPPPPVCNDPNDASSVQSSGKSFSTNDGVDTATTVTGVINGASDIDWYTGTVTDGSFALLQPNIVNATSGAELCVFVACAGGHATTLSCSAGTPATSESGQKGCCVSGAGALKPSWNCTGTVNDTATVSYRVKSSNGSNACLPYSFSYVF